MDINEQTPSTYSINWAVYLFLFIAIIVFFVYYTRNIYWNKYASPFVNSFLLKMQSLYDNSPATNVDNGVSNVSGVNNLKNTILKPPSKKKEFVLPPDIKPYVTRDEIKLQSGFCYIGEDRGFRSCISVGEGDICMSGDIFPSHAVCINPKLRV